MRNRKFIRTIIIAAFIILIFSFSMVLAAQSRDMTWFPTFERNSYKISLDKGSKILEKTDSAIFLSIDDLNAMLTEKYDTPEIHIELDDEHFKPDENNKILLPIGEEKTYCLGRVIFGDNKGWTANNINLLINEDKYLSISNSKEYEKNDFTNIAADYHSKLVNRYNVLPDDYNNENLSLIKGVQAVISNNEMKLDKAALEALKIMLEKANSDGVAGFVLNSTYRPYAYQKYLFDNLLNKKKAAGAADPYEEASKIVAIPGTSEHQTGMALDIVSLEYPSFDNFSQSKEYAWLKENCWDYGFIQRYPEDKTEKTFIIYEPWHFRYVGKPLSLYLKQTGLCMEELVESLQENKFISFNTLDEGDYIFMLVKKGQAFTTEIGLNLEYSLMELTEEDNLIIMRKGDTPPLR
ncbi:MAG: M15 family metallopeptidase [Lutispora sp.]|nr:M15 family metallopeptidase [Lutispora sp.]